MRFIFAFLVMFVLATASHTALAEGESTTNGGKSEDAGEAYAVPSYRELSQMLVMMDAVDVNNPKVADDYSKLMFCGIYYEKYKNDFEWNKVRQQLVTRLQSKKDYYRMQYELYGQFNLDRYNFDSQDFPLMQQTAMQRVGSMVVYDVSADLNPRIRNLCHDDTYSKVFPGLYLIELAQPLTFDRLKLPIDEAKSLLDRMNGSKNTTRRLYVRFRVRITGVARLRASHTENIQVDLKGDITSIDVFLDRDMTKFLTSINVTR